MSVESQTGHGTLFGFFLDTTDMVGCWPADATLDQINHDAAAHNLRFPLVCDPDVSLREHVAAVEFASSSARFGPFVDNILGMNWMLPSGSLVRVGERLIKSATGYDLQRFLLHSDGRYGMASAYVLRLRPIGGEVIRASFRGEPENLGRVRACLLHSPWLHWLDAVDLEISTDAGQALLVTADCGPAEGEIFLSFFREVSRALDVDLLAGDRSSLNTLPVLSLKTTVQAATGYAQQLVSKYGGDARVLCANGVVHFYPPDHRISMSAEQLSELSRRCASQGGHLSGTWATNANLNAREIRWAERLEASWTQL